MLRLFSLLCFFHFALSLKGQEIDTTRFWNSVDFMVIPYTEKDQPISEVFEKQAFYREVIGILQDQLIESGFKVKDFISKYEKHQDQNKRMKEEVALTKQVFLDIASPDVFIEVEVTKEDCPGSEHKVNLNIKSFLTASHTLLNRKIFSSNCFQNTTNITQLTRSALNMHRIFPAFNKDMKKRISQQMTYGQPLEIHLNINSDDFNFNTLVNTAVQTKIALHEAIQEWLYEHPVFEYDDGGGLDSDISWVLGEVSIPVVDPKNSKPYPLFKFTKELRLFLNSLDFVPDYTPDKITLTNKQIQNTLYIVLE